jgi:hypothetical protein
MAFAAALNQYIPLLGERGLLPVRLFAKRVSFWESPSLFLLFPTDRVFVAAGWAGVSLSCVALLGIGDHRLWSSVLVWAALWVLYLSFVNAGQTFYGFGWESILLETGFFATFSGTSAAFWRNRFAYGRRDVADGSSFLERTGASRTGNGHRPCGSRNRFY